MSPYENLLRHEDFRRVGLFALINPNAEEALLAAIEKLRTDSTQPLRNVHAYLGKLTGQSCVFVYLETTPEEVEGAAAQLNKNAAFAALSPFLCAHPRASAATVPWIRMELINVVGPTCKTDPHHKIQHLGYNSILRPEHELTYRTLHQTNWPGVVDQLARSHYRYWVTFLIELGTNLLLFTYCQYVGQDQAADDAAIAADPTTQRWWNHTEPCLKGPVDTANSWLRMIKLQGKTTKIP